MNRNKHRERGKMKRQRSIFQMKEQEKTLEKGLNEMDISNPPDKEIEAITKDAHQPQEENGGTQ